MSFLKPASFFVLFLALGLGANEAQAQRVKIEADLSGNTLASGDAKYESRGGGAREKFSVEVEDAAANTRYRIVVRRGASVIFRRVMTTNALGTFDLNRDTDLGQAVPSIQLGDRVLVIDIAARRRLLLGTF